MADKRRNLVVPVPAIVDEETWYAADAALSRYGKRGLKRTKHTYLLQGIAVCGICGAPMGCASTTSSGKNRHRLWYYTCSHRRRPSNHERCTLPMLPVGEVDRRVWAAVVQLLSQPRYVEAAIRRREEADTEQHAWMKDLSTAEKKLVQHEAQCSKMAERYRRGLIPDSVYDAHLQSAKPEHDMLLRQVEAARAGIDQANTHKLDTDRLLASVERLRERLSGADLTTQAEIVRILIPGRGEHVVRLGAKDIELHVVLAAEDSPSDRLSTFASG